MTCPRCMSTSARLGHRCVADDPCRRCGSARTAEIVAVNTQGSLHVTTSLAWCEHCRRRCSPSKSSEP